VLQCVLGKISESHNFATLLTNTLRLRKHILYFRNSIHISVSTVSLEQFKEKTQKQFNFWSDTDH